MLASPESPSGLSHFSLECRLELGEGVVEVALEVSPLDPLQDELDAPFEVLEGVADLKGEDGDLATASG